MKKKFVSLTLALVLCLSLAPTAFAFGPPIDIYIVESDGPAIIIKVGDTGTLTGENVVNDQEKIKWTSSDSSGLSIDSATGAYTAKRAGSYTLTATLADGSGLPASITITVTAAAGGGTGAGTGATATPSATKLVVNGKSVAVDAYLINESNYIKLRDLATMVNKTSKNFSVEWDGSKNAISLKSFSAYVSVGGEMAKGDGKTRSATVTTSTIYVDGAQIPFSAYLIGENNYFKLRDVLSIFGIAVDWDQSTGTATVKTEGFEY